MKHTTHPFHQVLRCGLLVSLAVPTLTGCRRSAATRGGGKLFAVSLQSMNNPVLVDLNQGLQTVIEAGGDKLVTLDAQKGKGAAEAARPVMRDLLGRFPEMDAVFPINDPSALGAISAISAIEAAGRKGKVTVVTVDGSREGAAAIMSGKLHSTSAQFPREIGRLAAAAACDHLAGKPVAKDIVVRVKLITKENSASILDAK
ncbi:MAG: substrate-binding domain-containing protein [Verrucomicrobia bacterium]|nr:substrate-binding domain-containing protein [Verrucomicrobiota bacterium]